MPRKAGGAGAGKAPPKYFEKTLRLRSPIASKNLGTPSKGLKAQGVLDAGQLVSMIMADIQDGRLVTLNQFFDKGQH